MIHTKRTGHSPKKRAGATKRPVLLLILLLIAGVFLAGFTYVSKLKDTFLTNVQFYMDEIAAHDKKSVDLEIEKQWERLEMIGRKLTLETYGSGLDLQRFLNLEMEATGFEGLMLLDDQGRAYEANYLIHDVSNFQWASLLLDQKKAFVLQNEMRIQFVVRDNSLLYGVPIEPVTVGKVTYMGLVGSYRMGTVRESLQTQFFDGKGMAQVVGRDGTVITSEVTQKGDALENLLGQLEGGRLVSGDGYADIKAKLSRGEIFRTVYTYNGDTMILTASPLENADWMVVVTAPYSVASSQTGTFLKITAFALLALGVLIAVIVVFLFISYRRTLVLKNSKEIFYRERLFNLLALHTDDVFAVMDPQTNRVHFISENIKRTLGIEPPGLDTPADLSFLPDEVRDALQKNVASLLAPAQEAEEHERAEAEFEWAMPDGSAKWLHVTVYPVTADFADRKGACLIVVLSDYTQVMKNQKVLKAAMEQAQEAARSKSMFLSNMSHEMRTPLNGIVGSLALMRSHLCDPDILREYLQKAEYTSRYLISLVNDILDMSKIESHMLTLEERELCLREVCTNLETMFRTRMEKKGLAFLIELKEPLWVVKGDEVRIQQVLVNLLSNAQKFTDAGGRVSLAIRQEAAGKQSVQTTFTVSDTGAGMSREFLSRIWNPFEQERLDTARLHGGSGLGLAITHELVELMRGRISVASELGKGSVFTVELTQEALRPDEQRDAAAPEAPLDREALTGRSILVAEDNELNREILLAVLKDQGVRVVTAVNGEEAVRAFARSGDGEIDAVLMDMQMPVMDGCEAARRIRKLDRADAESVRIVACTANAFQEDIDRALQAGMDAHVVKPLDMEKLSRLLVKLWKEKNA